MRGLFLTIVGISISTSIVIAALLLFSPYLNKRYAAKWKYVMWITIALRLVVPYNSSILAKEVMIYVPSWTAAADTGSSGEEDTLAAQPKEQEPSSYGNSCDGLLGGQAEQKTMEVSLLDIAACIWLAGSLMFLSVHIFSFLHYKRRLARRGNVVEEEGVSRQLCRLCRELKIRRRITVIQDPDAGSPMMVGILRPVLVLPDLEDRGEELFFALKHELVHLKRHDICFKLLFVGANALHWFNPMIYLMKKEAAADMELSCDECVIRQSAYSVRKAYAETIFATMSRHCKKKEAFLTTQFYGGKKDMEKRFKNILVRTKKKNGLLLCIGAVCVTFVCGTAVGCAVANDLNTQIQVIQAFQQNAFGQAGIGQAGFEQAALGQEEPLERMAYISGLTNGSVLYDVVEWVEVPGSRADELGFTEEDGPSGFVLYNGEEAVESCPLASDCRIGVLDFEISDEPIEISLEEFSARVKEREYRAPYRITMEHGEITNIVEQYVP